MAGNETTFTKLIAIKDGGGNPSAPGSADLLDLTFGSVNFNSSLQVSNVGTAGGLFVGWDGTNAFGVHNDTAFLGASGNPDSYSFSLDAVLTASGDALFSATGGDTSDPDFQVDGYAKFAGTVELAADLVVGDTLTVNGTSDLLGNVTIGVVGPNNPSANLTVTGISTLTGAVSAEDTLDVTNGATIGGTVNVTGAVDFDSTLNVDGDATFASNATVNGNLTVLGTLVTKQTESVLISDNYIDMNSDYTTASPQDTGLTFNYSPIASATVTAMDDTTNTITLSANSGISLNPGDIVLVTGLDAAAVQNEGLYEVLTFANDVITVNTASGLTFLKHAVAVTVSGIQATLAHVNLGVLRVATSGDLQYGENSDANITFGDVPYNGYEGSQSWTSDLFLTAPANAQGSFFTVSDPNADQVFGVAAGLATVNGDLLIANNGAGQTSYALSLNEVADGHPTVAANFGKVYTKSETTNSVAIAELFYTSEIDGVDTPVQITKNGQLNVDVLTFSLQAAYDDGNSIVTDAEKGGAVSISAGQGLTDALDVTGNVDVQGDFASSGTSTFTSVTGSQQNPDFAVSGISQFSGDVYMGSSLVVGPTWPNQAGESLTVNGSATIYDTLTVNSSTTLYGNLATVSNAVNTFSVDVASGNTDIKGTLTVAGDISLTNAQAVEVFSVDAATGNTTVAGILDLDGSVDADVTGFDVLSSGALNLVASSSALNITASANDVVITGSTIKLKGSFVASNINALAVSAGVAVGKAVTMTSVGLAEAQANAKDVIVLGVSADAMGNGDSAFGKIAEFGRVDAAVEANLSPAIAAGDKLYLSAATAGAVTNVAPTASDTTVFLMGVALAAPANGIVEMALRPQFLYSNY